MADARLLRIITIATFLPAFGLGIAHGTFSHDPVPAVGLVPLAFSSSFAIFLLSRHRKRSKSAQKQASPGNDEEQASGAPSQPPHEADPLLSRPHPLDSSSAAPTVHPILVFLTDAILAAALMVVLVFTWLRTSSSYSAELAMLAAYTTIPLLINFFIHLHLSLRSFATGLALHDLLQYTAWQTLPPDCPHCGSRLRPDSLPTIPWYESVSAPEVSLPKVSLPKLSLPSIRAPSVSVPRVDWKKWNPEWKTPAWFRRGGGGGDGAAEDGEYARLFVDERAGTDGDGVDEHEHEHPVVGVYGRGMYRDEEEGVGGGPSVGHESDEPVVEEVVVGRKDKKSKHTPPILGDEETGWP